MKPDLTAAELVEKLEALVQHAKQAKSEELRAYWLDRVGKLASENLPTILTALRAQTAGEDERASIVAWLRKQSASSGYEHNISGAALRWVADAIERGEHTRQQENGDAG